MQGLPPAPPTPALEKQRRGQPCHVSGCLRTGFLCAVRVGLQLEGPFQLLNSMALILVVEFQTQEWGRGGLASQR